MWEKVVGPEDFLPDLEDGELPQVSWLIPPDRLNDWLIPPDRLNDHLAGGGRAYARERTGPSRS